MSEIQELLARVWREEKGAEREFFELLFEAEVYVPLRQGEPLVSVAEGNPTIPIFSKPEFVEKWFGQELEYKTQVFRSFIWLVPDENWLHLDPSLEFGRQISPWDLSKLKEKPADFESLVGASEAMSEEDLLVLSPGPEYLSLLDRLKVTLEAYAQVDEASFILVSRSEGMDVSPVLDLKMNIAEPEVFKRLELEVNELFSDFAKSEDAEGTLKKVAIVTDGRLPGSPNAGLFSEVNPFYIRQRVMH